VNKQCFADGDPVVRIKRTGARPIDAMSAWATTRGPGTASLVASGRVTRMRVLRDLQLEPSHAVDTCVQRPCWLPIFSLRKAMDILRAPSALGRRSFNE
jgi:hypothetical protein